MVPEDTVEATSAAVNSFGAADVAAVLRERDWLSGEPSAAQVAWCERAAALLGPHASDKAAFADLLGLVFAYDAPAILRLVESHVVLARYGARGVLRAHSQEASLIGFEGGRFYV